MKRLKLRKTCLVIVLWSLLQPVWAQESLGEPVAGSESIDAYIQDSFQAATSGTEVLFPYHPNNTYKVYCQEGFLTDLRFEAGEQISFVGGGDTERWVIERGRVGKGRQAVEHLYIKPTQRGISTNIIVNTSRRSYQIHVISASFYNPSCAWIVETELAARQAQTTVDNYLTMEPEKLNFNYSFNHEKWPWSPERVFDDGKKTYLLMKPDVSVTDAPALFLLNKKGEIVLVNYRVLHGYYIVDRLFDTAILQVGTDRVKVRRKK